MDADLGLDAIYEAMAAGNEVIDDVVRRLLPVSLGTVDEVIYRQASVRDALAAPALVGDLYRVSDAAIDAERKVWGSTIRNPELILDRAAEVIGILLDAFEELRSIAMASRDAVHSPGFTALFAGLEHDLDEAFIAAGRSHVARLRDRTLNVSAGLGPGNRAASFVLHQREPRAHDLRARIRRAGRGMTVEVLLSNQHDMNTIGELRARALAGTAGTVHETSRAMLGFLRQLRAETGFLLGCVNLHDALRGRDLPVAFPTVVEAGEPVLLAIGLCDPNLALRTSEPVVGNDINAVGRLLVVVTGANAGGKSTLLRAVGLAQVMLQAGLFVAASEYRGERRSKVLTHFTRDEIESASGGRLHDELQRLNLLIDDADQESLVLLNESLSSTNERDGSEIARNLVQALVDSGVRVWLVTHHHELARDLHAAASSGVLFLRAERGDDGTRPFRVIEAPPLATAYGRDVYERVMGVPAPRQADTAVADAGED